MMMMMMMYKGTVVDIHFIIISLLTSHSQTVSDHHILQEVISYATAWRRCTVCISMVDISLVAVVATSRGDTCSY